MCNEIWTLIPRVLIYFIGFGTHHALNLVFVVAILSGLRKALIRGGVPFGECRHLSWNKADPSIWTEYLGPVMHPAKQAANNAASSAEQPDPAPEQEGNGPTYPRRQEH